MTEFDARGGATSPEHFPLTRRDVALIIGFWTFMAVLTAANGILAPRGRGPQPGLASSVAIAFIGSFLWAALTPPIFWLSGRLTVERSNWVPRLLLFVGAGVVVAMLMEATIAYLGFEVLGARSRRWSGRFNPLFGAGRMFWLDDFIVFIAVGAAGFARDYFLRYRARHDEALRLQAEAVRLQAQLAEARLDALRRQLDPHFLFNTLHAVASLVERDPRGVRRMIARLSELLRHSLEGGNEPEVPLRQELDMVGRYLDIMQVRFQGRLAVETRVGDRALDALVPNLILQPLVENAIKHGVERQPGSGRITIEGDVEGDVEGDALVLRVRDDGPGVTELPGVGGAGGGARGVGLRNTVARLEQLYGAEQHFTLRADDGGGTVAEIRLPYHTRADLRAVGLSDAAAGIARAG
jgi:two-component system, LytTR family, sensor kinase